MENARIVTLDPTGSVGRIVRGALELLDLMPVQIDAPTEMSAIAEIDRGAALLVLSADIAGESGIDLAFRISADWRDLPVIVLADEETEAPEEAPYLLLRRSSDAVQIVKAVQAALTKNDMRESIRKTGAIPLMVEPEGGAVPGLDLDHARRILDNLLIDVGALACILAARTGDLILERGAISGLEREHLVSLLAPTMKTGREVKELLGGQLSTIQFFDGETFDIFVLSVGLHHFLCVVYDGNSGSRQFGSVNRFGRRAAEDVIALVGANAFIWTPARPIEESPSRSTMRVKAVKVDKVEEPHELHLEKAELIETASEPVVESAPVMEPIADLDLDALFGGDVPDSDSDGGGLFDLDALEDLSKSSQHSKGKLDWDQAKEIGLIS